MAPLMIASRYNMGPSGHKPLKRNDLAGLLVRDWWRACQPCQGWCAAPFCCTARGGLRRV